MFTQAEQGNVIISLREQRNVMIETIFTYGEYYKLQSFTEKIPLDFSGSFFTGLCSVRHFPSTIIITVVNIELIYSNRTCKLGKIL